MAAVTSTVTRWTSNMNLTCSLWRYTTCAILNFLRPLFWKLLSETHTGLKLHAMPLRGWSTRSLDMPHHHNACLHHYSIWSGYDLTYDLWPFQQCPLKWYMYVASFLEIPPVALSSYSLDLLQVPLTTKAVSRKAFRFSAPTVWNSIPQNIRLSSSIGSFKRNLKTYLFFLPG